MSARPSRLASLSATRWFALVVTALMLVAAAGFLAGLLALDRLSDARVLLVDRIDPTVAAAERLRGALVEEETGVRGYAIASERSFLAPYRQGRREEEAAYALLERAARGGRLAGLEADLRRARAAARAWREEYAEPTIRAVAAGRFEPAPQSGKRRFDALRRAHEALRAELQARRDDARERLERAADVVLVLFVAGGGLLVLAVLAAAAALRATIIRPLARLADEVRRVAGGDFTREVRASGPSEIVELGTDVDAMRARIVEEVTALREAETALIRQAEDLQRSNTELEQFAYVASHDLQEPLRKVASFTQMLQRRYEGELDDRAHQYIAFAVDGAKRMQDLINDLLAFSRVGRVTRAHDRVDCAALAAQATANLGTAIEETGAEVLAGELPMVTGDASLLTAVFQNLVANAIKFRRDDRPPRIRIEAERADAEWRFSCTDNGIGVEPEYAERIFVIFQRLHTRTAYEGTGIGLAMCRKIVEYHGGRIWLGPPPPDGGSTFCFTLPADDEEPPA